MTGDEARGGEKGRSKPTVLVVGFLALVQERSIFPNFSDVAVLKTEIIRLR